MDSLKFFLSLLGVGSAGIFLIWAAFAAFNLLWAALSAVLAKRRGRNAWNWFFLSCIYGIFGFLFLACSKTLNRKEYKESDTLSKVLWLLFIIPAIILISLYIFISIEKKKDDELTRKVLQDMKIEHNIPNNNNKPDNVNPYKNTNYYNNPYQEVPADLNDFLGKDDSVADWNYTELTEEEEELLHKQGVYYSEEKGYWVKRSKSRY
ncbi:MAG: hypothetical protein QM751_08295 [Paludibacteraceae bacterium]